MAASEYHYRTELISRVICKQVELRLTLAISDFSTVKQAIEKLGGRLDIMVNNAGIQRRNPCEKFLIEDFCTPQVM